METQHNSISPEYFENIYRANPDPWNYTFKLKLSRYYEQRKYVRTYLTLPLQRFRNGLEIGCSIGVFSKFLALRCDNLLAIDYSATALEQARQRCARHTNLVFEQREVPAQFPQEKFDLIVLSEVAYYLSPEDFRQTCQKIVEQLIPGGFLLMVHWRWQIDDLPLTGESVHDSFITNYASEVRHLKDRRTKGYRLDLFKRLRKQN